MSLKTVSAEIPANPPVKVHLTQYSNCSVLFLTQVNKLGIFIQATLENPECLSEDERVYSVEVKFGDRCDEWSLALARAIVEKLNIGNLMVVVSITQRDAWMFNQILSWSY
ncbi:hypothetical protein SteCoe_26731 [Stentor coeruleus]|uniref:Uncharacterized protein n=1 Tax=Stentor coeruleus TaxID=5963 RepID=A0A1R2BCL1_9CILI|nr:hypothetical protein SteCoe_26731 [Stentor coeruleus]